MIDLIFSKFTFLHTFAAFDLSPCNPRTDNPPASFFGFPRWWEYINNGKMDGLGNCTPIVQFPNGIWAIAFAIIDMLLYLGGIIAVIMIIVAGVSYMTAGGNGEKAASARKKVLNAVIGLIIIFMATAVVSFIGSRLG